MLAKKHVVPADTEKNKILLNLTFNFVLKTLQIDWKFRITPIFNILDNITIPALTRYF